MTIVIATYERIKTSISPSYSRPSRLAPGVAFSETRVVTVPSSSFEPWYRYTPETTRVNVCTRNFDEIEVTPPSSVLGGCNDWALDPGEPHHDGHSILPARRKFSNFTGWTDQRASYALLYNLRETLLSLSLSLLPARF